MDLPQLNYPVYTLDNHLLLDAGTQLTPENLDALISTNEEASFQPLSFLEYGTAHQDLFRLIQKPPYRVIFDEAGKTIAMGIMEKILLIPPVIEALNYFKENDSYTYFHILIVFALSTIMTRDLVEDPEARIMQAMAGHMHDFGKICVPLQILRKSDPLTMIERDILEQHALSGFVLLSYHLQDAGSFAARVAKEHHERRDGSGYPMGILLRNHMVEIIAVCDVYDALLSKRPYRLTEYDNRTALEELTKMANRGKISWDVLQTLVSHNRKDKPHFSEIKVSTEKRGVPPADSSYGVIADEAQED